MKKTYILFLIALFALVVSCRDESLDPLLFTEVKKGTILALRGTQLDNVYNKGIPGAEVFPKIATGTEKFVFEGEYLSDDPASLASVDVYAIKGSGASTSRVLLTNVPFSQFTTGKYPLPSVTISIDFKDILAKLGLVNTFPLPKATVDALLGTYKAGINIETDLNLVDGTKVLAEQIVAQGLFGSNQFYPAMRLNYAMTDYCAYDPATWSGDFDAAELSEFTGLYDGYTATFTREGTTNKFTTDNFYDSGWPLTVDYNPSVDVATQTAKVIPGTITLGANVYAWTGTGTYNSCAGEVALSMVVTKNGVEFDKLVWKLTKP